jgi:hypothetical protein
MKGSLLLTILTVKASYARDVEQPLANLADVPDTLQWWLADTGVWRIRTYALDHDIHTYHIGGRTGDSLHLARTLNRRHYDAITADEHLVTFADCSDPAEVDARFHSIGLPPRLEIAPRRFAFWKPDDAAYRTQTVPRRAAN